MTGHCPVLPRRCSCGHSQQFMASCWRYSQYGRWQALSGRRWPACPPLSTLTAPWRLSNCSALPKLWKASFTLTQVKPCSHKQMHNLYASSYCLLVNTTKSPTGIHLWANTLTLARRLWIHRKSKQHRGIAHSLWSREKNKMNTSQKYRRVYILAEANCWWCWL